MYDISLISFKPLDIEGLNYMHKWLNTDFVQEWYGKKSWTLENVKEKYMPYINGEMPTQAYLIQYDKTSIGYIQTYKINDYEDYAKLVDIDENAAGLDLFVGEKDFIHRGLGTPIVSKFLKEIIFGLSDAVSCILGPEPHNAGAIRTYEKAGFRHVKTIQGEDGLEYIMRVSREELEQTEEVY